MKKREKKVSKFVYWTPRVLSIAFLLFLAMFSLDVFDMGLGFWGTFFGLFMHNIPVLILAGLLWISWKSLAMSMLFCLALNIVAVTTICFTDVLKKDAKRLRNSWLSWQTFILKQLCYGAPPAIADLKRTSYLQLMFLLKSVLSHSIWMKTCINCS